jgi:muconate cycloisomerase
MQVIVERYLAPLLIGRRLAEIAGIQQAMNDVVNANLYAKAAVEVALHDAWARSLDVPVPTLLGGPARTAIPVTWALGTESAAEVVEEAQEKLDAGLHSSFKLKMGAQDPADDVTRVTEVADELAGRASVWVDLNARWDLFTSLRWLPRLAEAGVDLVEQPVPGAEVEWLAEINAALPIPVMVDESLRTPTDALRLVRLRAADVFSLKTTKSGGPRYTRAITDIATAAGSLHLPDGPGLGVELDPAAVARSRRN